MAEHQDDRRRCVFCGRTGKLTREHVWPDWLSRFLIQEGAADWVVATSGAAEIQRAPMFSRTVKRVCGPCNRGWMHRLEDDVQPFLKWLILGRDCTLDQQTQRLLAFWAIKSAMVAQFMHEDRPIPPAHYHALYEGREDRSPPAPIIVWLGSYVGRRHPVFWGLRSHTVEIDAPAGVFSGDQAYTATMSVGHFVVQVFGHSVGGGVRLDRFGWRRDATWPIWPSGGEFNWPPSHALRDDTLIEIAETPVQGGIAASPSACHAVAS